MTKDPRTFAERRDAMAEAAGRLLREEGPAAVTHRRVAVAADIPVGSANHIFRTKDELYVAAVEAAEEERYQAAARLVAEMPARITDLNEAARLILVAWCSPPDDGNFLETRIGPMLLASVDPVMMPILRSTHQRMRPLLDEIVVRAGLGESELADLLPDLAFAAVTHAATSAEGDPFAGATATLARVLSVLESR